MFRAICFLLGLLFLSQAKAQDSISRRVVVHVLKTDTVVLTNDPAGQKAVYVDIRIVSEKKGEMINRRSAIIMELPGQQSCLFTFEKDKFYTVHVFEARYESGDIKKKYRKKYLRPDCSQSPKAGNFYTVRRAG